MERVFVQDLGNMDYREAWDYQEKLLAQNVAVKALRWNQPEATASLAVETADAPLSSTRHHLLLVEHPPVYTLGKSGKEEHLLLNRDEMQERGYAYYHINRGGDITLQGPGQIVGYPILDLEKLYTDIGRYLRNLEEVIIRTMAWYGIAGERSPGETGVWIDANVKGRERKICAIGIRCSRWVTMHGFAFNVNTDLSYFDNIIPCGIQGKQVTSLHEELGRELPLTEVKNRLLFYFREVFEVDLAYQEEAALLSNT